MKVGSLEEEKREQKDNMTKHVGRKKKRQSVDSGRVPE